MIKDLDQWDLDQWDLDQWELMEEMVCLDVAIGEECDLMSSGDYSKWL